MKKPLKISLISLGSLLGLIIIVLIIVFDIVLNSRRTTALVNKYASKFITCEYNIGKVDITFFKTFPDVGLEIQDLVLINKMDECPNDTLAAVKDCVVALNVKELLFNKNIVVNKANLYGGSVNAFINGQGGQNFDIFVSSEKEEEKETSSMSYKIDLDKLKLKDINLSYTDMSSNINAAVNGMAMTLKCKVSDDTYLGDLNLKINHIDANIGSDSTSMNSVVENFVVDTKLKYEGDVLTCSPEIKLGRTDFFMSGDNVITADFNGAVVETECVMRDFNLIDCSKVGLRIDSVSLALGDDEYLKKMNLAVASKAPLQIALEEKDFNVEKMSLAINDLMIGLAGHLAMKDSDVILNVDVNTNVTSVAKVIDMIPAAILGDALEGISADGNMQLIANVKGMYNENTMPVVNADVVFNNGVFEMPAVLPFPVTGINTKIGANVNLNDKTDVVINSLNANMNSSSVTVSGIVNDVIGSPRCDVSLKADVKSNDIASFIPDDIDVQGRFLADVDLKSKVKDLMEMKLKGAKIDAKVSCKDLIVNCFDTINVLSNSLNVNVAFPRKTSHDFNGDFFQLNVNGTDLVAEITDMMSADLENFDVSGYVSNILRDEVHPSAVGEYSFSHLNFTMDDINVDSDKSAGSLAMLKSKNEGNVAYTVAFGSDSLSFTMDGLAVATKSIALDATADYDKDIPDDKPIMKWNPTFDIDLTDAVINTEELAETVLIPSINMKYDDAGLLIEDSRVVLGNSDFNLKGMMTNLIESIKNDELLRGEFEFVSDYTDITQLLSLFSGMGSTDTVAQQAAADTTAAPDDPFMVPLGTDIKIHTTIKRATFDDIDIKNVGGDFTVKDGSFVLQEVGFTTDAAKMLLTAIYKSPRKNNLYLGFDFHLLDIDIAEMIHLVPDIDTIVPMLKSFAGKAEFHLAAETNLKADYSLKYSTLKAACSIEGADLVVLDNKTYDEIRRLLMFDKNTTNKIDSLDVQFTLFRNEIDVYPFVVSLDKYQAALYGRHNLDMSYDYNISVLNPPILNKLGLEIKGPDFDNMDFKLRKGKMKNIYKPEKRDFVEEKVMDLKRVISESLKDNLQTRY